MAENDNRSLQAQYVFEVDESSLRGMRSVLGGLKDVEKQTQGTAKASAGMGQQYASAARQMSAAVAVADRKVDGLNQSTVTVQRTLRPFKEQLRAIKAEARNIDFGDLTDSRQFSKASRSLGVYQAEIKEIRKQVQVTTQVEREFTAVLKTQEAAMGRRIAMSKAQRSAAIASERKGKAIGVTAAGAAVAAPLAAIGRQGVGLLVDYQDAISETQAITRATDEQMKLISKQAKDMGSTTRFTSAQAASAMTYLGMAGFKTGEIMESVGDTLNLAAAGHLDLAESADISSNVLSGFTLKAREMGRVTNVMALVAATANTSVRQMGEAMAYSAPAAAMFGASIEEAAAMVGIGGNIGIQASSAGTALRAGFVNLAKADKQAKVMDVFNVQVVDQLSHANRNIIDIIGDIKSSMDVDFRDPTFIKDLKNIEEQMSSGELGPEAYDAQIGALKKKFPQYSTALAGLADVFGKTAVSFWAGQISQYDQLTHDAVQALAASVDPEILNRALQQQGLKLKENEDIFDAVLRIAPDYQGAANIIDKATRQLIASGQGGTGAVEAMAKKMEDNIGGSFRELSSSMEYMYLNVLEPLTPIIRGVSKAISFAARQIGNLPAPVRTAIAVGGAMVFVLASLVTVAGAAGIALFGFQQYAASSAIAMQVMRAAAIPLTGFFSTAMQAFSAKGMLGLLGSIGGFVGPVLLVAAAVLAVVVAVKLMKAHWQEIAIIGSVILAKWLTLFATLSGGLRRFLGFAQGIGLQLVSALAENSPGPIAMIRERWAALGQWLVGYWRGVLTTMSTVATYLVSRIKAAANRIETEFRDVFNLVQVYAEIAGQNISNAFLAILERRTEIIAFYQIVLTRIRGVVRSAAAARVAAIGFVDGLIGGGGSAAIAFFQGLITKSLLLKIALGSVLRFLGIHSGILLLKDAFMVLTWAATKFQGVVTKFNPQWGASLTPFIQGLTVIRDELIRVETQLGLLIKNVLKGEFVIAALKVQFAWSATVSFIQGLLTRFVAFVAGIGHKLLGGLAEASPGPTSLIRDRWQETTDFMKARVTDVLKFFGRAGGRIADVFLGAGDAIGSFYDSIPDRIAALQSQMQSFRQFVLSLGDQISDVLKNPGEAISNAASAISRSVIGSTTEALQSLREQIVEVGRSAIANLGITGAIALAIAAGLALGLGYTTVAVPLAIRAAINALPLLVAGLAASGTFQKIDRFLTDTLGKAISTVFGEENPYVKRAQEALTNIRGYIKGFWEWVSSIIPEGGIWVLLGLGAEGFLKGIGQGVTVVGDIARGIQPIFAQFVEWIKAIKWNVAGLKAAVQTVLGTVGRIGSKFLDAIGPIGQVIKGAITRMISWASAIFKVMGPSLTYLTEEVLLPFIRALGRLARFTIELPAVRALLGGIGTALQAVVKSPLVAPLIMLGTSAIAKMAMGLVSGASAVGQGAMAGARAVRRASDVVAPIIKEQFDFAIRVLMEISRGVWAGVSTTYKAVGQVPGSLRSFGGSIGKLLGLVSPLGFLTKKTMTAGRMTAFDVLGLNKYSKLQKLTSVMQTRPTKEYTAASAVGQGGEYLAETVAKMTPFKGILDNLLGALRLNQTALMLLTMQGGAFVATITLAVGAVVGLAYALYVFKPEIFMRLVGAAKALGDVILGIVFIITHLGRTVEEQFTIPLADGFYELKILGLSFKAPKWAAYVTKALNVIVTGLKYAALAVVGVIDLVGLLAGYFVRLGAAILYGLGVGALAALKALQSGLNFIYIAIERLGYAFERVFTAGDFSEFGYLFWDQLLKPALDAIGEFGWQALLSINKGWNGLAPLIGGLIVGAFSAAWRAVSSLWTGGIANLAKGFDAIVYAIQNPTEALMFLGEVIAGSVIVSAMTKLLILFSKLGMGAKFLFGGIGLVSTAVAALVREYQTGFPIILGFARGLADPIGFLQRMVDALGQFIEKPFNPLENLFQMVYDGLGGIGGVIKTLFPLLFAGLVIFRVVKKGVFGGLVTAIGDVIKIFTGLISAIFKAMAAMVGFGRESRKSFDSFEGALGYVQQTKAIYAGGYVPEDGGRALGMNFPTRGNKLADETLATREMVAQQMQERDAISKYLNEVKGVQMKNEARLLSEAKKLARQNIRDMTPDQREAFRQGKTQVQGGGINFNRVRSLIGSRLAPTKAGQEVLSERSRSDTMQRLYSDRKQPLQRLAKRSGFSSYIGSEPKDTDLKSLANIVLGSSNVQSQSTRDMKSLMAIDLEAVRSVSINTKRVVLSQTRTLSKPQDALDLPISKPQMLKMGEQRASLTTDFTSAVDEAYKHLAGQKKTKLGELDVRLLAKMASSMGVPGPGVAKFNPDGQASRFTSPGSYKQFENRDKTLMILQMIDKDLESKISSGVMVSAEIDRVLNEIKTSVNRKPNSPIAVIDNQLTMDWRKNNPGQELDSIGNVASQLQAKFPFLPKSDISQFAGDDKLLAGAAVPRDMISTIQNRQIAILLENSPVIDVMLGFEDVADAALTDIERQAKAKKKGILGQIGDRISAIPIVQSMNGALLGQRSRGGPVMQRKRSDKLGELARKADYGTSGFSKEGSKTEETSTLTAKNYVRSLLTAGKTLEELSINSIAKTSLRGGQQSEFINEMVKIISTTSDRDLSNYGRLSSVNGKEESVRAYFPQEAYDKLQDYAGGRGYAGGDKGMEKFFNELKRGLIEIPGLERGAEGNRRKGRSSPSSFSTPGFGDSLRNVLVGEIGLGDFAPGVAKYRDLMNSYTDQITLIKERKFDELRSGDSLMAGRIESESRRVYKDSSTGNMGRLFQSASTDAEGNTKIKQFNSDQIFDVLRKAGAVPELKDSASIGKWFETQGIQQRKETQRLAPIAMGKYAYQPDDITSAILREVARANQIEIDELIDPTLMASELQEAKNLRSKKLTGLAGARSEKDFMGKTGVSQDIMDTLISGRLYNLDKTPEILENLANQLSVQSADELEQMLASRNLLAESDTLGRRIAKLAMTPFVKLSEVTGLAGVAEQQIYKNQINQNIKSLEKNIDDRETAETRAIQEAKAAREGGLAAIMVQLNKSKKQLNIEMGQEGVGGLFNQYIETGSLKVDVPKADRLNIKKAFGLEQGILFQNMRDAIASNVNYQKEFSAFLVTGNKNALSLELLVKLQDKKVGLNTDKLPAIRTQLMDTGLMDATKHYIANNNWVQEATQEQKKAIASVLGIRPGAMESIATQAPTGMFEKRVVSIKSFFLNLDEEMDKVIEGINNIPVLGGITKKLNIKGLFKGITDQGRAAGAAGAKLPGISSILKIKGEHDKGRIDTLQGMLKQGGFTPSQFKTSFIDRMGGFDDDDKERELLALFQGKAMSGKGLGKGEDMLRADTMAAIADMLKLSEKQIQGLEAGRYSTEPMKPFLFFLAERLPQVVLESTRDFALYGLKAVKATGATLVSGGLRVFGKAVGPILGRLATEVGHQGGDLVNSLRRAFPNNQLLGRLEEQMRKMGRDGSTWILKKAGIVEDTNKSLFDKGLDLAFKAVGGAWRRMTQMMNRQAEEVNSEVRKASKFQLLSRKIGGIFINLRNALISMLPGEIRKRKAAAGGPGPAGPAGPSRRERGANLLRRGGESASSYEAKNLAQLRRPQEMTLGAAMAAQTTPRLGQQMLTSPIEGFKQSVKAGFGERSSTIIPAEQITPFVEHLKQAIGTKVGQLLTGTADLIEGQLSTGEVAKSLRSKLSGAFRGLISRVGERMNDLLGRSRRSGPPPPPPAGGGPMLTRRQFLLGESRGRLPPAPVPPPSASPTPRGFGRAARAPQGNGRMSQFSRDIFAMGSQAGTQINTAQVMQAAFVGAGRTVQSAWAKTGSFVLGLWQRWRADAKKTGDTIENEENHGAADVVRFAWDRTGKAFARVADQMVQKARTTGKGLSGGLLASSGKNLMGGLGGLAKTGMAAGGAIMGVGFAAQQISSSLQTMGLVDEKTSESIYKFTELFSLVGGVGAVVAPVIGLVSSAAGTIFGLGGGLIGLVTGLGAAVFTFLISPLGIATVAIVGAFLLINEGLKRTLGIDILGPVFGGMTTVATQAASNLRFIFGYAVDWIVGKWEGLRDRFWPILQPIVQPALDVAQQLINALNHEPTDRIPEAWQGAVEQIIGWLQTLPIVGQLIGGDMSRIFDPKLILGSLIQGFGSVYDRMAGFFHFKGDNPLAGLLDGMQGNGLNPEDLISVDVSKVLDDTAASMKKVKAGQKDIAALAGIQQNSFIGPTGKNELTEAAIKDTLASAPPVVAAAMRASAAKTQLTGDRNLMGGGIGDRRRLADAEYSTQLAAMKRAENIVANKRKYQKEEVAAAETMLAHRRQYINRAKQDARNELGAVNLNEGQQNFLMKLGIDPDAVEAGINVVLRPLQGLASSWRDHMSAMKRNGNDFWAAASSDFANIGKGFRGLSTNFVGSSILILGSLAGLIITMAVFGITSVLALGPVGLAVAALAIALTFLSIKTFGLKGTFDLLWGTARFAFQTIRGIINNFYQTFLRIQNGVNILGGALRMMVTNPRQAWTSFLALLQSVLTKVNQIVRAVGGATIDRVKSKVQADVQRVSTARQNFTQGEGVKGKVGGFFGGLFGKNKAAPAAGGLPGESAAGDAPKAGGGRMAATSLAAKSVEAKNRTGSIGGVSEPLRAANGQAAKTKASFSDLSDVTLTLAAAMGPLAPAIAGPLFMFSSLMDGVIGLSTGLPMFKTMFTENVLPVLASMWGAITTQVLPAIGAWISSNLGLSFSSAAAGATTVGSNAAISTSSTITAAIVGGANIFMAGTFSVLGAVAATAWTLVTGPFALIILGVLAVVAVIMLLARKFKWVGAIFKPFTKLVKLFAGVLQQVSDNIKRMVNLAFLDELAKIWADLQDLGRIIIAPFKPLIDLLGLSSGGTGRGPLGQALNVLAEVILIPLRIMAIALIGIIKVISLIIRAFIFMGQIIATVLLAPIVAVESLIRSIVELIRNVFLTIFSPFMNAVSKVGSWMTGWRDPKAHKRQGYAKGGLVGKYAGGGMVRGGGTSVSDSILAPWLSNGEFVMPTNATRHNQTVLEMMRSGVPVESILTALPVAPMPPPVPAELLTRPAGAGAGLQGKDINITISFGDVIITGGGGGQEQAQEFMQNVEPQLQRAIADALRELIEKTR